MRLQGIDVEVVRRGEGQTMLVLHGGGGPVGQLPFVEKLARHFDVIAPTHPGFGGSKIPEHFDRIDDLVFLYLDLLDELNLRDVTLVGFSMGGWTAAELATMTTERVSRLILVGSVGVKVGGREDRDIADVFALSREQLAEIMYHDPSLAVDVASLPVEQLQIVAANRIALGVYTWEPYMHNPKLPGRLHRIKIPTHFIWGESDGLVKLDYGRAFCAMIPGASMTVIERAGHSPQIEQAEQFVEAVLAITGKKVGR
ncbi:MAG: pimeloyl-ACP methyl ester carboxylesterase [Gammaproteobacteria bacterium]|jgi:pimeloyl-ACP methyl ester carboxylesterase